MPITGKIKIQTKVNPGYLASEVMRQGLYDAYIDELLDVADELQQESYRGATLDLAGSWDVTAPRRESLTFTVKANIVNTSDRAINRVAGRPPGKRPPTEPLVAWVKAKNIAQGRRALGVAIAISRKIAKKGTDRFIAKQNFLDLNLDGSFKDNGRIEQIQKRIETNLERVLNGRN